MFDGIYVKAADTELRNRFGYHPPVCDEQRALYEEVRAACLKLATFIRDNTPASHEQDAAINAVDVAMMQANAALARHWPTPLS